MFRIRIAALALALTGVASLPLRGQGTQIEVKNFQGDVAQQQFEKITGFVKDAAGNPIAAATVTIVGKPFTTTTNTEGYFFFNNVPTGVYDLSVNAVNFRPLRLPGFRVVKDQTPRLNFSLLAPDAPQGMQQITRAPMSPQVQLAMKARAEADLFAQWRGTTFRFQLVSPTTGKTTDPAVLGLDSVLSEVLKFPGYRLLSQAAISMDYIPSTKDTPSRVAVMGLSDAGANYDLSVKIDTVTAQGARLTVSLRQGSATILSTSVTISMGHTVVLGTSQRQGRNDPTNVPATLILTVRPDHPKD